MYKCKFCKNLNICKNGLVNGGKQRWLCRGCNRNFTITKRKYFIKF